MGEARTDPVDGQTVLYTPARRDRPHDIALARTARGNGDPAACPFCPHNDTLHPLILEETPDPRGGWRTRVVPNRFPIVESDPEPAIHALPPYSAAPRLGRHEVIVETPRHDCDLPDLEPTAMDAVIETYWRRHRHLAAMPDVASVLLFRNRGPAAGASLAHPHAQIAGLPHPPQAVLRRRERAERHYERQGRCLLQDVADAEAADGRRLVHQDERLVAFVPFAATVPGEIWIVPTYPRAVFGSIGEAEKAHLGRALRICLTRLRLAFDDPDYNLVLCDSAVGGRAEPAQCWHLRIHPRTSRYGGYEIGWGDRINPSLPEADAAALRLVPMTE